MLPAGIQRELDAAIQRTGETPALLKAQRRLGLIVSMSQNATALEVFEVITGSPYRDMDGEVPAQDDTEEIECEFTE